MAQANDIVLAGTKAFALALFAPFTERMGTRPRIAPEPAQALALCGASHGLLVVEYGAPWLPVLTQLRRQAADLRIVAALPRGQEAAALTLGPLGIDAVPWDGQATTVLAAAERALSVGASAGATAARPAAPVRPSTPAIPVAPHAAPLRSSSPAIAGATAAPPLRPSNPAIPVVSAPAAAPLRPSNPAIPAVPAARPAAPVSVPVPAHPAAPVSEAPLDLFSDLGASAATPEPGRLQAVDPFAPPAAASAEGTLYVPPPREAIWPATAPTPLEAEQALAAALAGTLAAESPLRSLADQAVIVMSDLERGVLTGASVEVDATPIRGAAAIRLRISTAIATRPPMGDPVDAAAVEALLGEIDRLLAAVNGLLGGAPDTLKPALESIRNALVKEAVDFSESCHTGAVPLAPAPRSASARLISMASKAVEKPETRRGVFVLLVLAMLAAAAYHTQRYLLHQRLLEAQRTTTLPGAPAGLSSAPGGPGGLQLMVPLPGETIDPAQLERFKAQQESRGNKVVEKDGTVLVIPGQPAEPVKPR